MFLIFAAYMDAVSSVFSLIKELSVLDDINNYTLLCILRKQDTLEKELVKRYSLICEN